MQIIPVLDIAAGVAMHARAGDRAHFAPVESVLTPRGSADPAALLGAYRQTLGVRDCYVADLDAIQGGALQRTLIQQLAATPADPPGTLLVDAGTGTADAALDVLACGASRVIVGLETLHAFANLSRIVETIGAARTVFGLDLRLDNPILHPAMQDVHGIAPDPLLLAAQGLEHGPATLLVIDVGRVGTGCGVDLGLLEDLRRHFPQVRLLAGGGVLTRRDLDRMRDAGCDGVLVASALHSGRVTAADIGELTGPSPNRQSAISDSR